MQAVQLAFELQTKLYLLFVGAHVFLHLYLQLLAELCLFSQLCLQRAVFLGHDVQLVFEVLFALVQRCNLTDELVFQFLNRGLMLARDFGNEHLVVGFAAVLKQDGVDLPHRSYERVLVGGVLERLLDHVVKANAVHEQAAVDAVDLGVRHSGGIEVLLVNHVPSQGQFVSWLHNTAGNVQVLSVGKRFIDPSLDNAGIKFLAVVLHSRDLLYPVLKTYAVRVVHLPQTSSPFSGRLCNGSGTRRRSLRRFTEIRARISHMSVLTFRPLAAVAGVGPLVKHPFVYSDHVFRKVAFLSPN